MVMYTKQVHELLIHYDSAVNCNFCSKQIQDPGKPQRYVCCSNMKLIKDRHLCVLIVAKCMMNILLPNTWIFMKIDIR